MCVIDTVARAVDAGTLAEHDAAELNENLSVRGPLLPVMLSPLMLLPHIVRRVDVNARSHQQLHHRAVPWIEPLRCSPMQRRVQALHHQPLCESNGSTVRSTAADRAMTAADRAMVNSTAADRATAVSHLVDSYYVVSFRISQRMTQSVRSYYVIIGAVTLTFV